MHLQMHLHLNENENMHLSLEFCCQTLCSLGFIKFIYCLESNIRRYCNRLVSLVVFISRHEFAAPYMFLITESKRN